MNCWFCKIISLFNYDRGHAKVSKYFLLILLLIPNLSYSKTVTVIGTIHGDHKRFPLYNFETLKIVLEHIDPDLLLIEEDPATFREKWYQKFSYKKYMSVRPIEIKNVIMPFAERSKIKVIPTDWRIDFDKNVDKLHESIDAKEDKTFKALQHAYLTIFLDKYLTNSIYDLHSDNMMAIIETRSLAFDSIPKYKEMRRLDTKRQKIINQNIVKALRTEKYKKAVVIYGISHRPSILRAIKRSKAAKVLSLRSAMTSQIPALFERDIRNIYK